MTMEDEADLECLMLTLNIENNIQFGFDGYFHKVNDYLHHYESSFGLGFSF